MNQIEYRIPKLKSNQIKYRIGSYYEGESFPPKDCYIWSKNNEEFIVDREEISILDKGYKVNDIIYDIEYNSERKIWLSKLVDNRQYQRCLQILDD